MKDFIANFPFREISIFVIVICSFTYNTLLDRDVACTCKDVDIDCWVYLLSPACTIFFLMLWIDKKMRTTCQYSCACTFTCSGKGCRMQLCGVLFSCVLKAICVGLLWIVSVLVDGDWYVCCKVGRSEEQAKIACKDKSSITAEEKEIINEHRNVSRRYGFFLLLGVILLMALMSLCDWRRCCDCCSSRRAVYDTVILEEEENVLKEILKKAGKEELSRIFLNKISGDENDWKEYDVAAGMIENFNKPKLSKEQRQEWNELQQEQEDEHQLYTLHQRMRSRCGIL